MPSAAKDAAKLVGLLRAFRRFPTCSGYAAYRGKIEEPSPAYAAAAVNLYRDNKLYLHECVDSDGSYIRIEVEPAGNPKSRVTAQGGITTLPEDSAFNFKISHPAEAVNSEICHGIGAATGCAESGI